MERLGKKTRFVALEGISMYAQMKSFEIRRDKKASIFLSQHIDIH